MDIPLRTSKINLTEVLEEKSGDTQCHQELSSGNDECLYVISRQSVLKL